MTIEKQYKILHVEDDKDVSDLVFQYIPEVLFKHYDLKSKILSCYNLEQGIDKLKKEDIDVVIVDGNFPGSDDIHNTLNDKEIKSFMEKGKSYSYLKGDIIAFYAKQKGIKTTIGLSANADDLNEVFFDKKIQKPFELSNLAKCIVDLIKNNYN